MKLGSLFDGSGGFPLAGVMNGIEPVWASEIEPYPLRVTAARFPQMKQLGDVTKIDGAEIEKVDIITFGSPCQDLSVAGKRKGIHDGERSNLFFEAVRIIKEMREDDRAAGRADKHIRPRFAVWENVPGAFSSNKGHDFQAVLQALCEVADADASVPFPEKGKWSKAGCIVGDGYSIAWRVYDAQYWGVPQRRKRIYLIADFASERAGEILFERESVCGNPAQSREAREGTAADAEGSTGGSCIFRGVKCLNPWDSQTIRQYDTQGVYPSLTSNGTGGQNRQGVVYCLQGNGIDRKIENGCNGKCFRENEMYTLDVVDRHAVVYEPKSAMEENWSQSDVKNALRASASKSSHAVVEPAPCAFHLQQDPISGEISPCIGGQHQATVGVFMGGQGAKAGSIAYDESISPTLRATASGSNQTPDVVYEIEGNSVDRECCKNGKGYCENVSPTMNTQDRHAIAFDCRNMAGNEEISGTLQAKNEGGFSLNFINPIVYDQQRFGQYGNSGTASSLKARDYKDATDLIVYADRRYIVRRLTPLECCRLQGFPDWWEDGAEGSDSARYKMWGNGITLFCGADVLRRIAKEIKRDETTD